MWERPDTRQARICILPCMTAAHFGLTAAHRADQKCLSEEIQITIKNMDLVFEKNLKKQASSSGTEVFESGKKLYLLKKPAQWTSVALFVTGLVSAILLVNGIIMFISNSGTAVTGLVLLLLGLIILFAAFLIMRHRAKINRIPANELPCICIFDFEKDMLID